MALGNILKEARMRKNLSASEVAATTRMKIQQVQAIEQEDFSAFPAKIYGKGFIKLYAELVDIDPIPLIEEYINTLEKNAVTPSKPIPKPRKVLMKSMLQEEQTVTATSNKPPDTNQEPPLLDTAKQQQDDNATDNHPEDLFSLAETNQKKAEVDTDIPTPNTRTESVTPHITEPTHKKPKPILESLSYLEKDDQNKDKRKISSLTHLLSLKKIDLSNYNLKTIGISLAGLILIILIISSISRCSHTKKNLPAEKNNTLQLAFPPDDLYLE